MKTYYEFICSDTMNANDQRTTSVEISVDEDTHYKDVARNFADFLSAVYGYRIQITAESDE